MRLYKLLPFLLSSLYSVVSRYTTHGSHTTSILASTQSWLATTLYKASLHTNIAMANETFSVFDEQRAPHSVRHVFMSVAKYSRYPFIMTRSRQL
ncbi:hypothetical protein F4823DRAFT_573623 [Ustulina deusta]|nr:hypothetical protein F4823DRAFT_573623 [Ustulina deusta]